MLRYVTAGESHGKQLTIIIEGIPAGLKLREEDVNVDLARRQGGHGRGVRMKIEKDRVEFMSGVRAGETIGSPVCMVIRNADWDNWKSFMAPEPGQLDPEKFHVRARPGHADLPGALKFDRKDMRDILERASARETAGRVAAGAVCKKLLAEFGVSVHSYTKSIGSIQVDTKKLPWEKIIALAEKSPVRSPDAEAEKKIIEAITKAGENGDTVGGVFTVIAKGVPPGLGSHAQWDEKLDGAIARSLLSIQAIKGVEFGIGFEFGALPGSAVHDELFYDKTKGFWRKTNNAGGIEGGMSNGEDIVVSCVMKPIPSLKKPLASVNVRTKEAELAEAVRSDVCAVPAAGVIGEAAMVFEVARAMKEKFGGDSLGEMKRNYSAYIEQVKEY